MTEHSQTRSSDDELAKQFRAERLLALQELLDQVYNDYLVGAPGVAEVNDACVEITSNLVHQAGWSFDEATETWGTPKYDAACIAQTLIEFGYSMAIKDQAAALLERLPDVVAGQLGLQYGRILDRMDDD